jgi:hypothetical protein
VPSAEADSPSESPVVTRDAPAEPPVEQQVVAVEHAEPPIEQPMVVAEPAEPPVEQPVVVAEHAEPPVEQLVVVAEPAEPPVEQPVVVAEPPVEQPVVVAEPAEPPVEQPMVVAEPHDAEEPPAQLDGRPSRGTRLPVLVVAAVVLVATLVAYLGWRLVGEDGQDAAPTPSASKASTSTPTPSPAPTATPSASRSATTSPSFDVPPVEPPDGGSYLEVTVLESGDLDVDQWVRSSTPLTALRLSVPDDPLVSGGVLAFNLRASADGEEAEVPTSLGNDPAVITLADVHHVHLTYRLAGALLRSPSRADRALARTVALDLDLNGEPRREPMTISFRGATALAVICDGVAGGSHARCGRRDDADDWQVRRADRGAQDRVMALLELPDPSSR